MRKTRQREVILRVLSAMNTHPTADEVYQKAREQLPRISLGTVYRNLETLAARRMIQRLDAAGAQRRFDGNAVPHCHIRCTRCGRIEDLPGKAPGLEWLQQHELPTGYSITGYSFELTGLCPVCRRQK